MIRPEQQGSPTLNLPPHLSNSHFCMYVGVMLVCRPVPRTWRVHHARPKRAPLALSTSPARRHRVLGWWVLRGFNCYVVSTVSTVVYMHTCKCHTGAWRPLRLFLCCVCWLECLAWHSVVACSLGAARRACCVGMLPCLASRFNQTGTSCANIDTC